MRAFAVACLWVGFATVSADCLAQQPPMRQSTSAAQQIQLPAPAVTTTVPVKTPLGRPPTGLAIIETPLLASLSWDSMPNAVSYQITRRNMKTGELVQITSQGFVQTRIQDRVPDFLAPYQYALSARYGDGTVGFALPVVFSSPMLVNPPLATTSQIQAYSITLIWPRVAGAVGYRIDGPGAPPGGLIVPGSASSVNLANLPAGPAQWLIAAVYPGGIVNLAGRAMVTATVSSQDKLQQAADSLNQMNQAITSMFH